MHVCERYAQREMKEQAIREKTRGGQRPAQRDARTTSLCSLATACMTPKAQSKSILGVASRCARTSDDLSNHCSVDN